MDYWRQRFIDGIAGALIVAFACVVGAADLPENLLANPGFELRTADQPDRWDYFVQPKPGAVARLDNEAHEGDFSIWLHTPTPYEKEPVNNWSQNIIAEFGGETLRVSGFIRVAEAKEAALWLQCWRKRPWGVLASASTSIDAPVYGTAAWQEVSMEVPIPKGTDFVTLRCVLLGTGSAWFDDISVTRHGTTPVAAESPKAPAVDAPPAEEKALVESAPATDSVPEILTEITPEVTSTAEAQQEKVVPLMNQLESEVRRLREANLLLTDTLEQIQTVNQGLVDEMLSVQEEIRSLKEAEEAASAPPLKKSAPRVSPLIPLSEAQEGEAP